MVCFGIGMFAAQKEDGFVDNFLKKANMRGVPCRFYVKGATFPASNHISIWCCGKYCRGRQKVS